MSLLYLTKFQAAVVGGIIVAIGIGTGTIGFRLEQAHLIEDLQHEAAGAAAAFEPAELDALTATRADATTPAYLALKHRLQKLKEVDARIRYIGIYRCRSATDSIIFLVDSTAEGARDEPLPGEIDAEAGKASGFRTTLQTRQPARDGPLADSFGTSVTGYAPIVASQAPEAKTGAISILAINLSASHWVRETWSAAFQGAFYAWTLLGFPFIALLVSRRQGEQREAIRNLSEAVEQSHSAIVILDLEQRIEYVNRGISQQVGYSRRELIGHYWREFFASHAANSTAADMLATIKSGHTWEGEWMNRRQDGTTYPVHGTVSPVKHRDGSMACFVAILDDVTETKRKEAELREARDLAQAGDRAKGQFLATMSHEVRTPLNGIVGFTSLLLDTPLSVEQREFVQTIRASGEALIHLTGDILDYARIESGKLKLDPIACDPRECIEEALDLHAAKSAEKNIELLHRTAENVPSAVVVDGGRLRQVLVNLIGNAVKFTDRGEVEVTVTLLPTSLSAVAGEPDPVTAGDPEKDGRATLEFRIRDSGIGISPEQHTRLFKPFSQVDESSTRRFGGAGLGLAICKNLVHLMGGEISVTSTPGLGSTFVFTIRVPVAAAQPPVRDLDQLRVGLAIRPGPLHRELVDLLGSWNAVVEARDSATELFGQNCEIAVVEVCEDIAKDLANRPDSGVGLPPEKTVALVPISLSSELRSALRRHFRLLVNRPVHQNTFYAFLSGSRPSGSPAATPATQFGFRVLVVEDNDVNQRLVQRVLTGLGCTSRVVGDGHAAIEELSTRAPQYDVILLDLHMPGMDGLSALEKIRSGAAGPQARMLWIIALTADVRPEQRAKGFAGGLDDYLTKPLRVPELETALRRFRSERLARRR